MTEQQKLGVLLSHWVEHNEEHAAEFRDWAEQAGPAREGLLQAATALEEANRGLHGGLSQRLSQVLIGSSSAGTHMTQER
jgi:hypothetical protein